MEYPDIPTGVGVQALIVRYGKALLGKKRVGPGAGFFDLPGGFVDPEETLEMAVTREVQEEIGCNIIKHEYFFSTVEHYANRQILVVVFLCEIEGKPQDSDEMDEFQWVSKEIPLATNFDAPKIALKKYFSYSGLSLT